MRLLAGAGLAVALIVLLGFPSGSSAACTGASCGIPECWEAKVRLRPGMDRAVRVYCRGATSARLVTPPEHSDLTNVSTEWAGLTFNGHPHDGAPRFEEAVFEITGQSGSIEQRVTIEVVPTEENSAPVCRGDRSSQRSDGTGPVDVYPNPYCYDPDGDDFVMEGGPPGVHGASPRHVPAGESESNWRYTTATFSGEETTTVWATDSLGARSEDAELRVTVGPGIDRLPECAPSSWSLIDNVRTVFTRPGRTRRFGVICTDADGDPFVSRLSELPEHGVLALVEGPPDHGSAFERWSDATYVPVGESLERDLFAVTATGLHGEGPAGRVALLPHAPDENYGGACGWSPAEIPSPGPGVISLGCSDDEGDPLSVEVVTEPHHGTLAPAVVTPGAYGWDSITIAYVPDLGYEGYDCVVVRVTDGRGLTFTMSIDIWVRPPVKVDPPELPELPEIPEPPDLPDVPLPPLPPDVTLQPSGSKQQVRPLVEQVLGTRAVKRVRAARGVQVWARSKLPRRKLLGEGAAPGIVVVCPAGCRVRADAVLAAGAKPIRSSRRRSLAAVTPGQPHVLSLTLGDHERQALRSLRKARARFTLKVRRGGVLATSLKRTIRVSK